MENELVAREALKKMFRPDGTFYVCDLKKVANVMGVIIPSDTMNKLECLHCISWRDMEPETRKWVAMTVDSLFTNPDNLAANYLPRILGGRVTAIADHLGVLKEIKA